MELIRIKQLIEAYDYIVIYRHVHPDMDALGSQLGLKTLIMENYPNKTVLAYGMETLDNPMVEPMDRVIDLTDALTILLDTSTLDRADDTSFMDGKCIAKIDHHLKSEVVCENEYVDASACAASLIIARLALEAKWHISAKAASYLYAGILTDSVRLSINTVNKETFFILGLLADQGIDINAVNRACYDKTERAYRSESYFRNQIVYLGDTAYLYVLRQQLEGLGIAEDEIEPVELMGNIRGIDKYAAFTETSAGVFKASLRSHRPAVVHICQKYGGGGHKLACGAKNLTYQQTQDMIGLLCAAKD